jgi:single-stranded DNA-specific DHH superfamily exonuclease
MATNPNTTNTSDITATIQDLINSGYTPERLYSYALEELNRQNKFKAEAEAKRKAEEERKKKEEEAKAKEAALREKKLKGYRNRCIGAFRDYIEFLTGEEIDKDTLTSFCGTLDKLESIVNASPITSAKKYDNFYDYISYLRDCGFDI